MSYKYTLDKLSEKGFELRTSDLTLLSKTLEAYCCADCLRGLHTEDEESYLYELLDTPCGAEFMLEEN